jgi:hypothetical protein
MPALRIDDFGASSKRYERHRGKLLPYQETSARDLRRLIDWLYQSGSAATLAITACWVTGEGKLLPYAMRFPEQTKEIRRGVQLGVVEIAAHGLTHCIPGRHVEWRPWRGNRAMHREFIDALPFSQQAWHMVYSRCLLEAMFGRPVITLVPPGNAISDALVDAALELGYTLVTCRARGRSRIADDSDHVVLHDRDFQGRRGARTISELAGHGPYTTVWDAVSVKATA